MSDKFMEAAARSGRAKACMRASEAAVAELRKQGSGFNKVMSENAWRLLEADVRFATIVLSGLGPENGMMSREEFLSRLSEKAA